MNEESLLFSRGHLWIRLDNGLAVIGVTYHYLDRLATISLVELKEPGAQLARGEVMATLESSKAAVDLETPISGRVETINEAVIADPELINRDPLGRGWLMKIQLEKPHETESLLNPAEYQQFSME